MADPKGDYLYVNLGPSRARRRLKGFGHGVRKVQSAGRNRAVITHTATGRHLEELKAKFADVGCSASERELSESIENLRNLGPTSAAWLRDVGVRTREDLQRLGPAFVYRLIKQRHPQATLNLLWSLAAGLDDRDWRDLTEEEREPLRAEAGEN